MSEQRVVLLASGGTIPASINAQTLSGLAVIPLALGIQSVSYASGQGKIYIGGSGNFCISGGGIGSNSSGGVIMASCGPIISATLRSNSGNGAMVVGGVGIGNAATSGVGIELFANETITLKVTNTNQISLYNEASTISGQGVTVLCTAGIF